VSDLIDYERVRQGNIGRTSAPVEPAGAGSGLVGNEENVIQFSGDPTDPQVITISLAAVLQTALRGPFTALIDFASGLGDQQRIEADIPTNRVNQANLVPYTPGGGLMLTVVASSLRVSVRNDASFAPSADGPLNSILPSPGVPFTASIGIGGAAGNGPGVNRTIWGQWTNIGVGLAPAGFVDVTIPPFARTFRVLRGTAAQPVTFGQIDANGFFVDGPYSLAALTPQARNLEIAQNAEVIRITNTGAANILKLGCVFQLGGF